MTQSRVEERVKFARKLCGVDDSQGKQFVGQQSGKRVDSRTSQPGADPRRGPVNARGFKAWFCFTGRITLATRFEMVSARE